MEYPLFSRNVTVGSTGQEPNQLSMNLPAGDVIFMKRLIAFPARCQDCSTRKLTSPWLRGRPSLACLVYLEVGVGLGLGGGLKVR